MVGGRGERSADEDLMLAYRDGDARAFETLYHRHKGPLYRYLTRQCGDRRIAEELFQDVWARLIQARRRYTVRARFTTYLYTLAHNRLIDHYRRQGRLPASFGLDAEPRGEALAANPGCEPEQRAVAEQTAQRFAAALAALPEAQREAWLLREESGLSVEEIAIATGVAHEAAKSRLRYANKRLRKAMGLDP